MARLFTASNQDLLGPNNGVAGLDVDTITICAWVRQTNDPTDFELVVVLANANTTGGRVRVSTATPTSAGHRLRFKFNFSTTNSEWDSDADFSNGVWRLYLIKYDGSNTTNVPTFFYGSGSSIAISAITTPVGSRSGAADSVKIGEEPNSTLDFDGDTGGVCFWDKLISAGAVIGLENGVNPFAIEPANIQFNIPINGNESPEPDYGQQDSYAVSGSPAKSSSNPPVEL